MDFVGTQAFVAVSIFRLGAPRAHAFAVVAQRRQIETVEAKKPDKHFILSARGLFAAGDAELPWPVHQIGQRRR